MPDELEKHLMPLTRRKALTGVGTALTATAGCLGGTEESDPEDIPGATNTVPGDRTATPGTANTPQGTDPSGQQTDTPTDGAEGKGVKYLINRFRQIDAPIGENLEGRPHDILQFVNEKKLFEQSGHKFTGDGEVIQKPLLVSFKVLARCRGRQILQSGRYFGSGIG